MALTLEGFGLAVQLWQNVSGLAYDVSRNAESLKRSGDLAVELRNISEYRRRLDWHDPNSKEMQKAITALAAMGIDTVEVTTQIINLTTAIDDYSTSLSSVKSMEEASLSADDVIAAVPVFVRFF